MNKSNAKYPQFTSLPLNQASTFKQLSKSYVRQNDKRKSITPPHTSLHSPLPQTYGQVFDHGVFGVFGVLFPKKLQLYKQVRKIALSTIK